MTEDIRIHACITTDQNHPSLLCAVIVIYLTPLPSAADAESTSTYNRMRIQLEFPSLQSSIITKDVLLGGEANFFLPRINMITKIFPNINM